MLTKGRKRSSNIQDRRPPTKEKKMAMKKLTTILNTQSFLADSLAGAAKNRVEGTKMRKNYKRGPGGK